LETAKVIREEFNKAKRKEKRKLLKRVAKNPDSITPYLENRLKALKENRMRFRGRGKR